MLAAGAQPQAKAGLVQGHIGRRQGDERQQHEPVELKAADVHQKRLFRVNILNGGGHIVHALSGVHGLDEHGGARSTQQVHGGAYQRLIRLEVDGGNSQQQGVDRAHQNSRQHHQQDHQEGGCAPGQKLHHQRASQGAHDHDALQADVDDAGVFGEAAAQCHQHQNGGKDQRILQQQDHFAFPPSSALSAALAAFFSSRRSSQLFSANLKNSTKPQR